MPARSICLAGVAKWNAYDECAKPDECKVGSAEDKWIQDLPVNDLEGVWEDDNEEKSYTFFRATFDGQDFAIFAKDSFDTNT